MKIKRVIALLFFVILVSAGAALTLKANIGVGSWDGIPRLINELTSIKVGTMGMVLNISCVLLQIVILRKRFKPLQLLQIPISILLGVIINFMLYDVLSALSIEGNYILQLLLCVVGLIICAFAVGAVMTLDIVTFALEGACMAISKVTGKKFAFLRQLVDIICIVIVLSLCFILNISPVIREGTIIGMLIFAPVMGYSMELQKPIFKKLDLID